MTLQCYAVPPYSSTDRSSLIIRNVLYPYQFGMLALRRLAAMLLIAKSQLELSWKAVKCPASILLDEAIHL